jgi:hypothetical protein
MSRAARRPDPFHVPQVDVDRATRWPIGQPVTVTQDDGSQIDTYTRSAPWRLDSGTWVILLAGFAGGYALKRVTER